MNNKIEKMLRCRMIAIVSGIALAVLLVLIAAVVITMSSGDYNGRNKSFAKITATGEAKTISFDINGAASLYFMSEDYRSERALFTKEIPNLRIVNSDEYRVEITTNEELVGKLDISEEDGKLYIGFKTDCYNDVKGVTGTAYKGLYVDCTRFDVIVYAPISELRSSAEINLDFDAPGVNELLVIVTGEVSKGRIYNVDSSILGCNFQGDSDVTIEGKVTDYVELVTMHNSRVDADNIEAESSNIITSCRFFGVSTVKCGGKTVYPFTDTGFLLTVILVILPLIAAVLTAVCAFKFLKYKKIVDNAINKDEF